MSEEEHTTEEAPESNDRASDADSSVDEPVPAGASDALVTTDANDPPVSTDANHEEGSDSDASLSDSADGSPEIANGDAVSAVDQQNAHTPLVRSRVDDSGDAARIADDGDDSGEEFPQNETSGLEHDVAAYRIAVELKRVETEVREILEMRDPKRKRKLAGSRRWRELEEEMIGWSYSQRFDGASIARLRNLVARRNYLFDRLRFVTGTRSRWNS